VLGISLTKELGNIEQSFQRRKERHEIIKDTQKSNKVEKRDAMRKEEKKREDFSQFLEKWVLY
jgi:hypothetical protein